MLETYLNLLEEGEDEEEDSQDDEETVASFDQSMVIPHSPSKVIPHNFNSMKVYCIAPRNTLAR